MQLQAIPLLKPYAQIIGTGSEYKIAHDFGLSVLSPIDGEVVAVDASIFLFKTRCSTCIYFGSTKEISES